MKNNNTQIDKKIFIAGKVYDLLAMDKDTVEASVQTYLDNAIGKDRVRFEPVSYTHLDVYKRQVQGWD